MQAPVDQTYGLESVFAVGTPQIGYHEGVVEIHICRRGQRDTVLQAIELILVRVELDVHDLM